MQAIRERTGLKPADLGDDILTATEPLVLRGLVRDWPAVQAGLQSPEALAGYLLGHWRDATVGVMLAPPEAGGRLFYNDDFTGFNFERKVGRFDVVLGSLMQLLGAPQPPALYIGATSVDTCLPGFRAENDLGLAVDDPIVSLWLGNRSRISAHFDLPDNVACVVAGRRRFTLFPPEQIDNLYVGPLDFTPAGQAVSLVDFHAPDFDRHPRFREALAHGQEAELEPGDALFIPSMWWHHVEALSALNLLVNYWWRRTPDYMDSPINALMLALLTMRGLPPEQRRSWRHLFDHYIFDDGDRAVAHIPAHARHALAPLDDAGARAMRAHLLNRLKR
ncbi:MULTISPECIES: cupin-like domain-containing protein [Roseateles]|uniref:JmjC domain-containing protein n=1 Tax=Pelomonas aquatica TaxID=431058 RepID=A0ABU1ZEK4_9BURK|nr:MULTISPECIES: cupin-like domain-containing protein [Roseateles]KQY86782.1 cupin [Pelomonas sp. Root1444]MDR7299064.1 hypothetical protein [Pelomonas aquatica]